MHRGASGTRCSRPDFMRLAGMIQSFRSKINLAPGRPENLAGTCSGQDEHLEGEPHGFARAT